MNTPAMDDRPLGFRTLLDPVPSEDFFERYQGKRHLHIPGREDKFAGLFSWETLNRLLNMSKIWSAESVKMSLEGRNLEPEEFCRRGMTRDGHPAMIPDPPHMKARLREGATLVLDLIETLTPEIAELGASLQVVMGGPVSCNAYCSWEARQGFGSHFDTTDVFAIHIAGTKTWRLYEGRMEHAAEFPGFNSPSFPQAHHERAKGRLLEEVKMTPGDVLYLPKGQYHDALATADASLHLSFGVMQPIGHDFMNTLVRSLPNDSLFRQALPHFDDAEAHRAHLMKLADRLRELINRPETSERMRAQQRQRALRDCVPWFHLPERDDSTVYRVKWLGAKLVRRGNSWVLKAPSGQETFTPEEAEVAGWVLARDLFREDALRTAFAAQDPARTAEVLDRLGGAGVVERL